MILWGPPGVGKTTIARLLADKAELEFVQLSAVFSGVSDLRKAFDAARARREMGRGTLLFVDEIHRTENPSFELNGALLSRAQVFVLNRLDTEALSGLLRRAEKYNESILPLTEAGRETLLNFARDGTR